MELTDLEAVVQRQLDAYNNRDVESLLAIYADDAQQFEHPSKLLAAGSAELRARFQIRFQEPNLYAKLVRRIVMGNIVIDREKLARTFPEGQGSIELIATYEVLNGRIAKAWFIFGPKVIN